MPRASTATAASFTAPAEPLRTSNASVSHRHPWLDHARPARRRHRAGGPRALPPRAGQGTPQRRAQFGVSSLAQRRERWPTAASVPVSVLKTGSGPRTRDGAASSTPGGEC
ncbi:hypothetical protein ACFPM0_36835 [Pseudonocardia sulfidoxydans]|uniref:hypothetical protein n=1 Tax=Pseudonocardia sulfidoxydans TaxID=54011 RepID=UPI00360EB001